MAIGGELETGTEVSGVAPGNEISDGDGVNPGQRLNAGDGIAIESVDLVLRFAVGHHGDVEGEHAMRIEAGLRGLERKQSLEEHAGSGEKDKRSGDLRDREDAQAAAGTAGDAQAGVGKPDAVGRIRRGKTRHIRQQDSGNDGEYGADPEQARIHGEIHGANGESRGVARQNGDDGPRAENAEQRAGPAEQQAFGEQSPAQGAGARSESGADGQFAFTANAAGQNEIGNIGAGDDEDQSGCGKEDEQNSTRI